MTKPLNLYITLPPLSCCEDLAAFTCTGICQKHSALFKVYIHELPHINITVDMLINTATTNDQIIQLMIILSSL